jgi:hypothetical protein
MTLTEFMELPPAARQEISRLQMRKQELTEALQDLLDAIPDGMFVDERKVAKIAIAKADS